jgi:hypothetical protein
VVVDTKEAAVVATGEVEAEVVDIKEVVGTKEVVVVVATVVEGTTSDELPLPETTTDEMAVIPVDILLDETTTEGMNLEGTITDEMIDLPGETMTEIGVLLEGTTEIGTMTGNDPSEHLPLKAMVETRKYHARPGDVLVY